MKSFILQKLTVLKHSHPIRQIAYKNDEYEKVGYKFTEIIHLTIKINLFLSYINTSYYLKKGILRMRVEVLRV